MLNYSYTARNPKTGQKVKALVQADNEQAASKLIKAQGLTPLEIQAEKAGRGFGFKHIKTKDKVLFSRQLATLINAGLPLTQSLRSVGQQTTNKSFKVVINQIINDIEAGTAFSKALEKHPAVFNRVYISLVAAGEASGTLDAGLERLAIQQEKDADIISKVRGAMIYPLIVLAVMLCVSLFMIIKVLPQVQSIYAGLPGVSLPILTRVLLAVSQFITHFWWIILIVLGVGAFLGTRWAKSLGGRSAIDAFKMRAWPIGNLYMKMYMARFARTGTTLVASGVPLLQVLDITGDAVDNVHIQASLRKAVEKVKGGKALSDAIDNDPNFLELVPNMLRIGEQSGALENMMAKVADYYEKEVDNEIKNISTIIEPVMMIVMGIIAITIVAAILLPIYSLVNQAGFTGTG
jgi:type IV pilus assembly protein PilC